MILKITAFGHPVLRQPTQELKSEQREEVAQLVADMYETMYNAGGVGLAAPQVNKSYRLFIVDGEPMQDRKAAKESGEDLTGFKKVFINPVMLEQSCAPWGFEEGCLSIPGIREVVNRPAQILIRYLDADWQPHEEFFTGLKARIIQHEYDHIEGVLFFDHLSALKKQLMKGKLARIVRGETEADYPLLYGPHARAVNQSK